MMMGREISETFVSTSTLKLMSVRRHRGGMKRVEAPRVISKRKPVENIRTYDSAGVQTLNANVER